MIDFDTFKKLPKNVGDLSIIFHRFRFTAAETIWPSVSETWQTTLADFEKVRSTITEIRFSRSTIVTTLIAGHTNTQCDQMRE